jgi:hypothetical protein
MDDILKRIIGIILQYIVGVIWEKIVKPLIDNLLKKYSKGIIISILVIFFAGVLLFILSKPFEPKTGDLSIFCNEDSVKVFMNEKFVGFTSPIDKNPDNYILEIKKINPGSYLLHLKNKKWHDLYIPDVKIESGNLNTIRESFPSDNGSVNIDYSTKKQNKTPNLPNELIRPNRTEYQNTGKDSAASSGGLNPKGIKNDSETNVINKPALRRLSILLTGNIKLDKVRLYVDSAFKWTPSSYGFFIDLTDGEHKITLSYEDDFKIEYVYSATQNISGNHNLIIDRKDFKQVGN